MLTDCNIGSCCCQSLHAFTFRYDSTLLDCAIVYTESVFEWDQGYVLWLNSMLPGVQVTTGLGVFSAFKSFNDSEDSDSLL